MHFFSFLNHLFHSQRLRGSAQLISMFSTARFSGRRLQDRKDPRLFKHKLKSTQKSDALQNMFCSVVSFHVDMVRQRVSQCGEYMRVSVLFSLQCWRRWAQCACCPGCNMMNKFITELYSALALQHSGSSYAQTCLSIK